MTGLDMRRATPFSSPWRTACAPACARADFVCRIGGDEFVILLPEITDDEAAAVARRIISRISEPFEFAPTARSAPASASHRRRAMGAPPTNC